MEDQLFQHNFLLRMLSEAPKPADFRRWVEAVTAYTTNPYKLGPDKEPLRPSFGICCTRSLKNRSREDTELLMKVAASKVLGLTSSEDLEPLFIRFMNPAQPRLCEDCGLKKPNFGLPAEGKKRWCAGCAKGHAG